MDVNTPLGDAEERLEYCPKRIDSGSWEKRSLERLHDNEVEIEVHYCAINFADIKIMRHGAEAGATIKEGKQQKIGSEFSGVVRRAGRDAFRFGIGEKVFAVHHWGGGFASRVVVPESDVQRVPLGMTLEEGAAFGVSGQTAYHLATHPALKDYQHQGHDVLIYAAAGASGNALLQLLSWKGFKPIAVTGTDEKKQWLLSHFPSLLTEERIIVYRNESLSERIHALTNGKGCLAIFDANGGSRFHENLAYLSMNGMLFLYGNSDGSPSAIAPYDLVFDAKSVIGFSMRVVTANPAHYHQTYELLKTLYQEGKYRPVMGKIYSKATIAEAFALVAGGKTQGKQIVNLR